MNKLLLFSALFLLFSGSSFAQNQETKNLLAEIEGKWELDNSGNVTLTRVIEVPGMAKDDIYLRGLGYFTYNYNKGDSVIQVEDKEKGTIIGKGIYPNVHTSINLIATTADTYHIIRLDAKDGRARVIISLTDYRIETSNTTGGGGNSSAKSSISSRYPITSKDGSKNFIGRAFYKSYQEALKSFDEIEKTLREGSTGQETEDW